MYSTEVLKSNLCDYNGAYILVRGDITIVGHNITQVAFKNCATFTFTIVLQKLMEQQKMMQYNKRICRCIVCWNIVRIILKQQFMVLL